MSTIMSHTRLTVRRTGMAFLLMIVLAGVLLARASDAQASGHSWFAYKAGKNCQGKNNRIDPVGFMFITHSRVADMAEFIQRRSYLESAFDNNIKRWTRGNWVDDIKGQQGAYYRGSTRVCSSFNDQNATGGATDSRYHVRWHTGGPSSQNEGYNIIAGTPHYDKLCGAPFHAHHEIWTFSGARTQLAKVFPTSVFPGQWLGYVGNTISRTMHCLNKNAEGDGWVRFVFAEAG